MALALALKQIKPKGGENDRRQNNSGLPMGMQREVGKYHFQTRKCSSAILVIIKRNKVSPHERIVGRRFYYTIGRIDNFK